MFEVVLSPSAAEFYAAADQPFASKLARCFRAWRPIRVKAVISNGLKANGPAICAIASAIGASSIGLITILIASTFL